MYEFSGSLTAKVKLKKQNENKHKNIFVEEKISLTAVNLLLRGTIMKDIE